MSHQFSASTEHIDVRYVAQLARLHLSDEEAEQFQGQLDQILAYVEQLDGVDVEGVSPTSHAVELNTVLRADEQRTSIDVAQVEANAPEWQDGLIRVPKIIE